ncbi:MAG TPA: 50S ribosomal protein L11 methyltransferase [Casimicrobiaceae bacterium]|nr:50S ribosomal protein L11 methyltransferase [Casimicrobiaceae bacterium]
MPFCAVRFDTDAACADRWSDALLEAGALSVDVSDPAAGTPGEAPVYGEPGGPEAPYWAVSRLEALFATPVDAAALVANVARDLDEPLPLLETREVADRDWVRITQAQFGPIAIAEDFHVVPSWCDPPTAGIVLRLDPGLAFGTGSHPTTRLCLEWLRATVARGDTVLDYGCGSGILAIAAAKLGAREVTGTDIDPQALRASAANARANGVDVRFVAPDRLAARACDVVVANILAHPLILLAPALAARTAGRIALSGILDAQAVEVVEAYAPWFTLGAWRKLDGWVLLAGARARPT